MGRKYASDEWYENEPVLVTMDTGQTVGVKGNVTLTDPKTFIGCVSTAGNVDLSTLISGEDQTNDVMKTEQQFGYAFFNSASTQAIKATAGFLHTINVGAVSCPSIVIFDSAVGSGTTIIWKTQAGLPPNTYKFDIKFTAGLSVDAIAGGGGVAPVLNISYR